MQSLWTENEVAVLKDKYATSSWAELKELFKKSRTAIRLKAWRLGLVRTKVTRGNFHYNNESRLKALSDLEKGYVAGLIDGEGSFVVFTTEYPSGYVKVGHRVTITNTNPELGLWLKERLGFGSLVKRWRGAPSHYKECYYFAINRASEIEMLLSWIKDSLIIKGKQAGLMLKLVQLKKRMPVRTKRDSKGKILGEEHTEESGEILEIYEEIRALNQ